MHFRNIRICSLPIFITASIVLLITGLAAAQVKPPQITPLSPNAAALWKYSEFPVNMYTGIPSISIPIYEIKSGGLTVPISLSYHAGGNRYEDQASWVGLGWNINAGGAVNRNVKGKADESVYGIFAQTQPLNTTLGQCDQLSYLQDIVKGNIDAQPDEFTYSMPGKSGRFVYKQTVAEPLTMPYDPIKITKTYTPENLSAFKIVDENGNSYFFGNNEQLTNPVTEITTGGLGASPEEQLPFPGSWLLTEIQSPDNAKKIYFNYLANSTVQKNSKGSSITVTEGLGATYGGSGGPFISYGSMMELNYSYLSTTKYLSEILFENGKIEFVQTTWNRTDLNYNQKALDAINIYSKVDGVYSLVKKVVFTYSYFQRKFNGVWQNWKLKLNKVEVFGKNAQLAETYSFEYHTDNFSGDDYYFPPFAIDYWGFYNGKTANQSLIPSMSITPLVHSSPILVGNADRNVDPAFLTEGVLKKITYPTGGFTNFEYEPHQYLESGVLKFAGGLRVSRISSTESAASGIVQEKNYKYGQTESGEGFKNFYNNLMFYTSHSFGDNTSNTSISSSQSFQMDGYDGSPVVYPYVTEYFGTTGTNNGKIKYVYDNGSPIQDNLVICYEPHTSLFFRKTNHWKRGNLTAKTTFDKNNNNVSSVSNTYEILKPSEEMVGLVVQKKQILPQNPYPEPPVCPYSLYIGESCIQLGDPTANCLNQWHKAYVQFSTGVMKMTKTTEISYDIADPSRSVTSESNYVYDANYLQPIEVNKTLRKLQSGYEEQVIDYTKYPFNYSFTGAPSGSDALGIKLLKDKNIITAPVEQYTVRKFKNPTTWQSDITAGSITTYRSDKPYPSKIWQIETTTPVTSASFGTGSSIVSNAFTKHSTYKEKLAFTGYDASGNITQYNKVNDINNTYLWDYLNVYPVAEVINADSNNVAFTSFEAENKGKWNYTGTPVADATAPTGKKAYTPSGANNITKSGLTSGTTYIVSYWTKNTSPITITGTIGSATAGKTLGLWKYYEHRVTGQTSVNISSSFAIDEVRLYPVGALMTTYTHEPLIGLLSQCDPASRITYYEYDNIGRLQLIRDQDRNIIKTFEYKYKTPQ